MLLNRISPTLLENRMVIDIINALSGFGKLGIEPYRKTIKIIHYEDAVQNGVVKSICNGDGENVIEKDFFSLFRTLPPFEPIHYPKTNYGGVEFSGDRIWVIEVSELSQKSIKYLKRLVRYNRNIRKIMRECGIKPITNPLVLLGQGRIGNYISLEKIVTLRIIGDLGGILHLHFYKNNRSYRISYGIEYLRKYIPLDNLKLLNKSTWQMALQKAGKAGKNVGRYKPESLDYITYCFKGRCICTDPIAVNEKCPLCGSASPSFICLNKPGLGRYHYRRSLFPKVYSDIDVAVNTSFADVTVPFKVEVVRNIPLLAIVNRFTMYLPWDNILELTLRVKPYTTLRSTNGILVAISRDFVKALVEIMASDSKGRTVCDIYFTDSGASKPLKLLEILATKYVISSRGIYSITPEIEKDEKGRHYVKLPKIESSVKMVLKNPFDSNFIDFVGKVLSHTLAHVLLLIFSQKLSVDMDSLIYVYNVADEELKDNTHRRIYYAGLFEANDFGTLRINRALEDTLKDLGRGNIKKGFAKILREFMEETYKLIEPYVDPAKYFEEVRKPSCESIYRGLSSNEAEIVRKVKEALAEVLLRLIDKNVILDYTTFKFLASQLVLDEKFLTKCAGVSKEKLRNINVNKLFEAKLEDFLLCIGPNYCMDGCNKDIYLEKNCTRSINENLLTSRCLLKMFLEIAGVLDYGDEYGVSGNSIFRIIQGAKRKVHVETAFTSSSGISALHEVLKRGVKVYFVLDRREFGKYRDELEALKKAYGGLFEFRSTAKASHEKVIEVDDLKIITSWNYGTGGGTIQTLYTKYKPLYS